MRSIWSLAVIAIHLLIVFKYFNPEYNDFTVFYSGAYSLRAAGSPYSLSPAQIGVAAPGPYPLPPLLAYVCYPLAWLDEASASYFWLILNLVLTGLLAWRLAALVLPGQPEGSGSWRWLFVLGLFACYVPQISGNIINQLHNVLAIVLLLGIERVHGGKDIQAGIWVGIASLLKIFPAILILALFAARAWRAAFVAVAVSAGFVALTWQSTWQYVSSRFIEKPFPVPLAGQHYISLPAMAERLFTSNSYVIGSVDSPTFRLAFLIGSLGLVAVALVFLMRLKPPSDIIFAAFLCAMLLATPAGGFYHLNLAVVAAALLYRSVAEHWSVSDVSLAWGKAAWLEKTMFVALLLTAIPNEYGVNAWPAPWGIWFYQFIHTGWGALLLTPQTYGLVLLLGVCLALTRRWKSSGR